MVIDKIYHAVTPVHVKESRNINNAIMGDSKIITISAVGKLLTIDSERSWLGFCKKKLRDLFQNSVIELDLTEPVEIFIL